MKRCTTVLDLPSRGREFQIKMPAHGVIRRVLFDARMPNALLIKPGKVPEPELVPVIVVEFSPDDVWLPRAFVVVPINTVIANDEMDLVFVDAPLHPQAGLFVMFEMVRPGSGCFGCAAPEGCVHAENCPVVHPQPDAPALQVVEPTEVPS